MSTRILRTALATIVAGAALLAPTGFSTAAFTSSSSNTATVRAAVDWTPPSVSLQNPGTPVKDTVTLTAAASDAETGVKDVAIQHFSTSGGWVTICTVTQAPYTCAWNTKTLTDGSYSLRAVATDNAGYTSTSATVQTTVANNLLVVLADPGDFVRGSVALQTTLYNAGGTTYTVRVEYAPAGTTTWKSICSNLASPYACTWNTPSFANGSYDLRSVAAAGSTTTVSAIVPDVMVDNQAPTVTMSDPGSPLSGVRTFAASASDAHSGLAQVVIEYQRSGGTWQPLCSLVVEPWSCVYDTTKLLDGTYSFRAVATDAAGNAATSPSVTNRVIDNTVSSVTMLDPGAFLSGRATLEAAANSTAGVTSVRIQRAPSGSSTWTDVCTVTTSPYRCTWDTTTAPDGLYDFRAVLLDGTGATTTSAVVSSRRVDNTPLRGYDVQTANGGATAGKLEPGDTLTYTYNDQVALGTVTPGWNGGAQAVTLRVRDGGLLGLTGKNDTVDIQRAGSVVNLGTVNLKEDYVKGGKTAVFNATMTAGTASVNGILVTTVTIKLGTLASGDGVRTVSNVSTMAWTPSASVTDLFGNTCSTATALETGVLDREF
ncbi:Ig-like domain-containing protein [Intrasporangium sp. DVR]|uniref:Ig-like domain-containing protein n=1 Tax=Intrasporangium sp. DVR TaxID=3127867 RepID=UPI00313A5279